MGLFSKKDKAEKKTPEGSNTGSTTPPSNQPNSNNGGTNVGGMNNGGTNNGAFNNGGFNNGGLNNNGGSNNLGPAQKPSHQNSYHDSAYYSTTGNSVSEEAGIQRHQQTQLQNSSPGTTITTTTTTTTVTTTVTSDGRTHTSTHPYNAATDPPIQSQQTSINNDTSRTSTLGSAISTNATSTNPNSSNTVPQSQTNQPSTMLQPTPERPGVNRTISPGRKPTPQEMGGDSHFNIIPPTPQGSQSSKVPASPTTTGGRVIPPRSERRVSPSGADRPTVEPEVDFPLESPGPPLRSEKRNSIDRGYVAPLKTSHSPSNSNAGSRPVSSSISEPRHSYEPPPVVPPKDYSESYYPGDRTGQSLRDSYQQQNPAHAQYDPSTYHDQHQHMNDPYSPGGGNHDSRSHTPTYTYQRPGPTVTSPPPQVYDAPPTSASAMHPPVVEKKPSHRQSLTNTFKGITGASEVIRGTINSGIAKTTHDKAEQERMRAIRDQGMKDYKASGLQERIWSGRSTEKGPDGTRRLRKRSLSRSGVHGTEGPGGLEPVEERSISSQ